MLEMKQKFIFVSTDDKIPRKEALITSCQLQEYLDVLSSAISRYVNSGMKKIPIPSWRCYPSHNAFT
jgi:hypothetical protein